MTADLKFAMSIKMKSCEELVAMHGKNVGENMFRSWRSELGEKSYFLIGWCDSAFAYVDKLGGYGFNFISGHPLDLFNKVEE